MTTRPCPRLAPIAIALVLLAAGTATASQEAWVPWASVEFVAAAPDPFGNMTVALELAEDGALGPVTIESEKAGEIEVPKAAWDAIPAPRLSAVRTSWEVGYDPDPWFYVKVPYGEPLRIDDQVLYRTVVIAVQGDKAVYRALVTPKAGGQRDWKQETF